MSAIFAMQTYLSSKSETQLKNLLIKINGPRALLTGSKPVLVTRLEQAAMGVSSQRKLEVGFFISSAITLNPFLQVLFLKCKFLV